MRNDAVGFFWDDTPPPKAPKAEKLKRVPPAPTWLAPDYLPGLEEARRFPVKVMTWEEMLTACINKEELIVDVEVYPNYFLACFTSLKTGWVYYLESYQCEGYPAVTLDTKKLSWILSAFTTTGFNSWHYDMIMCFLAVNGCSTEQIKWASDKIIVEEARGVDILRSMKAQSIKVDHIDLIEVAPLRASLKTYAGRLHCPKMQDLPFHPSTVLSYDQMTIVRWYCVNDITNTAYLRECLREHVDLRYKLSNEYKIDLRSKSDAQIAEAVIGSELKKLTGVRPTKPKIEVGTAYHYRIPSFIKYQTPLMNWALDIVRKAKFVVGEHGSIDMPFEIKALKLQIANSVYRMGIGGLHSSEETVAHHTDQDFIIIDKDVTSYYPYIILNQGLYPVHLGQAFLTVFRSIVERRVAAKRAGQKVVADSLKIVVNGSFGKLGSKYSILYAPDLLIQTTITGQLSLLMLIERLELAGISVVSANTDGIVIKVPRAQHEQFDAIVAQWERDTNFETEETRYMSLYSRDVNNYIAVKQKETKVDGKTVWIEEPDGTKNKGAYANPWASKKNPAERLHKNPTNTICVEAVEAFLTKGTPIDHTIRACNDITKMVAVRSVKGGAVKVWDRIPPPAHETKEELIKLAGFYEFAQGSWLQPGQSDRMATSTESAYKIAVDLLSAPGLTEYLGKSVRWYYGKDVPGEMVYASSGNKVPRSEGAVPLMSFNDNTVPPNIDHDWYTNEAYRILEDVGARPRAL